jgi:NAD(P)H-dependent FMN reductase
VRRWDINAGKPAKPAAALKVVGFTASPREGSNSIALVQEALRGAASLGAAVEQVDLAREPLAPCVSNLIQRDFFAAPEFIPGLELEYCSLSRDCRDAAHKGQCVRDDRMDEFYRKILAADALVFGFPIYNGWEPASLFNFMERWARHESCLYGIMEPGRRGMVLATWGFNDPGCYDHVLDALIQKLKFRQVEVVEALSVSNIAGMLSGLDEKGSAIIRHFPAEMAKSFEAGKTLVSGVRQ